MADYINTTPSKLSSSELELGNALEDICLTNGINPKKLGTEGQKISELELFFNSIKGLNTLSHFPNLTKLVVFGSELKELKKIDFCYQLLELWLCESELKRIPDLTDCLRIQRLYLYQNELQCIENLIPLSNLQVLNLSCNRLSSIKGLETCTELLELNLAGNLFTTLGCEITNLKRLKTLNLSGNQFESVVELHPLQILSIKEFDICQKLYPMAPLCNLTNYKLQIIYCLQSLEKLNGEVVPGEAVQEATEIICRKVIYYNMKNKIQKRSIYKYMKSIRKLSHSRLRVPKDAIKNLQAELVRLELLQQSNMKPVQKASVCHKITQIQGRLNYWKEFHRKLKREQRNAMNAVENKFKFNERMIELELLSGGNIRFEEIMMDSDSSRDTEYIALCEKLVQDNCSSSRRDALGLEAIQISRLTRIYNKLRRTRFDCKIDELTTIDQQHSTTNQSYVFMVCDPSKISVLVSVIENNPDYNVVATSPLDADQRLQKNYNSSFLPPTTNLILCRVYLGRCLPIRGDLNKAKLNTTDKVDSYFEETLNGRKFRILNWKFILPEFIIGLEFVPKPRPFPPLIFHIDVNAGKSQFTPKPTQEQEDRDYEVLNSNPKSEIVTASTYIKSIATTVTYLSLVGMKLTDLPNLICFTNLEKIDLSCNDISEVRASWICPSSVTSIDLSNNNMEAFSISMMSNLEELNLAWNLLHDLAAVLHTIQAKLQNLANLDLRSNLFIEDENQDSKTHISVIQYCRSHLAKLKVCQGVDLKNEKIDIITLNEDVIMSRGRTGDPERCLRLVNSSQYLHNYPTTAAIAINNITSICLDNIGLKTIRPLQYLFQLKYISFCNNNVNSIKELKSSANLIEIHANANRLKNISADLNHFTKLKIIDVSKNYITNINLDEKMNSLAVLDLSCNQIEVCNTLTNLVDLKQLFIADNNIADSNEIIQLKSCAGLEILDICDNPYQDKIDGDPILYILFHFPFLKALNGIPTEQKDIIAAREHFGGRLTVDFLTERFGYENGKAQVNLSEIQDLDLQDCDIRSVHLGSDVLCNLTSFNLVDNNLQNFSGIIHLKQLKTLCLNKNSIESVFPLTKHQRAQMNRSQYSQRVTHSEMDLLNYHDDTPILPKLEVLHLGFNKVKDMTLLKLKRFPVLKSLFLESNEIMKVDGLEGCHEIRHLVLDRNRIKDIDSNALLGQWRLEELHIDGNRLTSLSNLRHLVNLKRFYIGLNRIQEIAEISKLNTLQNLTEISMIGNGVARRMLHRPMLVWQCPSLVSIDGIKVDLPERQNAEFYFMEKGHEPVFPQLDALQSVPRTNPPETLLSNHSFDSNYYRSWSVKNQSSSKHQFQPTHYRGTNYNGK